MDGVQFDQMTRTLAAGASRRRVLGAAALGVVAAGRARWASAKPKCRQDGHPCEGNQECCDGLTCQAGAHGSAKRCRLCEPEGLMQCSGTGFVTCDHGRFVYRDCAPGTQCRPFHDSVLCDWPQNP